MVIWPHRRREKPSRERLAIERHLEIESGIVLRVLYKSHVRLGTMIK